MATAAPAASCMSTKHGCVMFDCLVHLWEWLDPPTTQTQYEMENKKLVPATQQPLTQQHLMAHHVHPDQTYVQQHAQLTHLSSSQAGQIQPNGVMHQLLQSQYHSNMNARSPLLENRQDLYGTGHSHDYSRYYGANDNYNYPQSPPRHESTEGHTDHNVNHELHNIPKGYNAEVYQDYLKRNPPKDTNQIYQNHQPMYRPNINPNSYGSKPYLPYSTRVGPQSNTELLRRQYSEIQQMKIQQQLHYQNQAQMHQQQKFAERQLLLQQIHGVQPPANLQNSIYSDSSYRDLDQYSSKNDFKEYSSSDIQKDIDSYAKNNEYKEYEKQRQYQDSQWQTQQIEYREQEQYRRPKELEEAKSQSTPSDYHSQKNNISVVSPMKSSESSSPSVKSPSTESRRSSSGNQTLRSPIAQRIPSAPVTMSGILYKQGSDGLKVWRKRWFVLSEYCLFYYKSQDEAKLLGSVLLPSYKVSACMAEDKVLRKYAFKLEHANMRTYILAAPDQEAMMKWVKLLTMAALMQSPNDQPQRQGDRTAVKPEDGDDIPTYANAPPKPRRSNEGHNSPSPDMYDPNYDLLKNPASHYSQGHSHTRHQDQQNYATSPNQESTYTSSPQSPPPLQYQTQPHNKRHFDTQHLSLQLTNTANNKFENRHAGTSHMYPSDSQLIYFNRTRSQEQSTQKNMQQSYDRKSQQNPFLDDTITQEESSNKNHEALNVNARNNVQVDKTRPNHNDSSSEHQNNAQTIMDSNAYNRELYGELSSRPNKSGSAINDRLLAERRTPDAYGRSTSMSAYNKGKKGDYEDVYGQYIAESQYGKTSYAKLPHSSQDMSSHHHQPQLQRPTGNYAPEKSFSGPAVLRRKKMQSSGIQPPLPRPHSADFLEYESKAEMLNKTAPSCTAFAAHKEPQRPKSSLDINSYYDPSSDRYYSEESYAEKMRQSAQYLQQGLAVGARNMDIPLANYASGLAKKQLSTAYSQMANNNYGAQINTNKDSSSYSSKYGDVEGLNSNWTLKEKVENQKDYLNRSGSVMSDGSNISGYVKDACRYDGTPDGFMRSASARLPSSARDMDGEKKVQQREESMKRLLEWKQRMLQSPLTRKSTPATISLARSLNQSRQSLRSEQSKSKTYTNASYNSYSSDDEEEAPSTNLQKPRNMQAGRSHIMNLTCPMTMQPIAPHGPAVTQTEFKNETEKDNSSIKSENTYQNLCCTISTIKIESGTENDNFDTKSHNFEHIKRLDNAGEDGYETSDSEAISETQIEYTDNDLDEVLLESDDNTSSKIEDSVNNSKELNRDFTQKESDIITETPPLGSCISGENHYLPMSPRKIGVIEPPHKAILDSLSVFDQSMPQGYEDNPYVEMNIGNEKDDTQTYEIVCVTNGKIEPVYMEVSNSAANESKCKDEILRTEMLDTASKFAESNNQTLKRVSKHDKTIKETSSCSNIDDDTNKDASLDLPFNRFSISDTFRPASYYLNNVKNNLDQHVSPDRELISPPPAPSSSPPCEDLSDDALSKYVLDKLDQSDMSQDNSILKMLTCESQKMSTVKRKTTSLMIYGSKTSIHDTLSRGEKIRNSRASLTNDRNKTNESSSNLLNSTFLDYNHSSSLETDSLVSYSADKGSSRLSLESDVSSKFDIAPSNISSEVTSLNDSDLAFEFRHPIGYQNIEMLIKRRPLSDESLFELVKAEIPMPNNDIPTFVDLDRYLDNLQPSTSEDLNHSLNSSVAEVSTCKDNVIHAVMQTVVHSRCSSTPVNNNNKLNTLESRNFIGSQLRNISCHTDHYRGSQSSCSSSGIPRSPISYYCKNYDEEKLLSKNLNNEALCDKVKEFESEKIHLTIGNEPNTSSTSTGFHSRESSTEHSAPYYYSDLSSQEHINVSPTSHYLKNTNLHRKLNNQRRRGPLHKKTDISHIHNPIKSNQVLMPESSFELATPARSVSVEFLSAADKDPEIDMKNLYESTGGKISKIPESMLLSGLGCKKSPNSCSFHENSSLESNSNVINANSLKKLSSTSMSSHCSGNSSNTVYYDAEADAGAYENVISQGDKHWDEDSLWRDNLRRVSHRHARSMDDLDSMAAGSPVSRIRNVQICGTNSIKRVKKDTINKICRNVTYVNCDIQGQILRNRENIAKLHYYLREEQPELDENDVYVSLATDMDTSIKTTEDGVYEQLALDSLNNSLNPRDENNIDKEQCRNKFEIDRENLRQWDLMSSGLMKGRAGHVRGAGAGVGTGHAACSTDTGTDSAGNEASMTISGTNTESGVNNNSTNTQSLSKKSFLGSNTSIGRNSRDASIPVRAVSPRVRWIEDKTSTDHYGSQNMSTSQQNLHTMTSTEDSWVSARSPSRASQQPIRAVSPRIRRNTDNDDTQRREQQKNQTEQMDEIPTAGELLGRTHEELVLLLIQLRRRHAATHRAIEQCCSQISSIEDCLSSLKAMERAKSLQRLEQLKIQLMELEHQYEKSKPLVQLVDNMVKLGSLYNRPGSTIERLERNQRLRQKVLAEHAVEQQRWLESVAAGKPLETEAARARVAELWALEQELSDEAAILQGMKTDKDAIENLLSGVRGKLHGVKRGDLPVEGNTASMARNDSLNVSGSGEGLEAELARVQEMLAHNSKKLEQTVADNARLERELQQLRRALQARRAAGPPQHHAQVSNPTAMLEDEVSRVQQLVTALQRQRQELSRAVRHLTQQSHALQTTHDAMPGKRRAMSSWQETNLDTGHTIDHGHGHSDYDYDIGPLLPPGHYEPTNVQTPLYVDTRGPGNDVTSPLNSEDLQHTGFGNLSNVEKQEIKTVRIVKRESERRQRDRERSLQPMTDWPSNSITANLDQFLEEELIHSANHARASSLPRGDRYENQYPQTEPQNYLQPNMELSPKYVSSPSLSNYDYSQNISSLSSSYNKSYDRSGHDRTMSISTHYLNSPTDSSRTLTNDPLSKTSSVVSLTRSHIELSPIFKSEAAKQIITEMSGDTPKNGSLHRRQVPKEKRRHYTAPHHLSAKTLNEMPKDTQDKMGRAVDDADMERVLRGAAPDVVRSALPPQALRLADNTIDQLLAAPQKILIPERYIPEKPPELSPEEQQKRQEKVESIKKMLTSSSTDPNKSPDADEKRQRVHLLQMNQILAKQVTEMSKIIAVKALEELPRNINGEDSDDHSPDVELPIYQQRDNFFT